MSIKWPTKADVDKRRDDMDCSIRDAVRALEIEAMLKAAAEATTVNDLREVVRAMLMRMH